jgi:hypothetical protein
MDAGINETCCQRGSDKAEAHSRVDLAKGMESQRTLRVAVPPAVHGERARVARLVESRRHGLHGFKESISFLRQEAAATSFSRSDRDTAEISAGRHLALVYRQDSETSWSQKTRAAKVLGSIHPGFEDELAVHAEEILEAPARLRAKEAALAAKTGTASGGQRGFHHPPLIRRGVGAAALEVGLQLPDRAEDPGSRQSDAKRFCDFQGKPSMVPLSGHGPGAPRQGPRERGYVANLGKRDRHTLTRGRLSRPLDVVSCAAAL